MTTAVELRDLQSAACSLWAGLRESGDMFRVTPLLLCLCFAVAACATAGEQPDDPGDPVDAAIIDMPDAADNPPMVDAAPPDMTDASVDPVPDAMVPDAAPMCTTQQLLPNGNFDSGGGMWNEDMGGLLPIITMFPPSGVSAHSPPYLAVMGTIILTSDELSHEIQVPAGAMDLQLLGQHWITTDESGSSAYDDLNITIQDASGIELLSLGTRSNVDASAGWVSFVMESPLTFAGQTIRLHIDASNDISNVTTFSLDSLSVLSTVCN